MFQGSTSGTLTAYRADTGKPLWVGNADTSILTAPISYDVQGQQFVAVVAGAGGGQMLEGARHTFIRDQPSGPARILVFSLQGNATLPSPKPAAAATRSPIAQFGTPQQVALGEKHYAFYCARCHGHGTITELPRMDLQRSAALGDSQKWRLVVFAGLLKPQGMPGFIAELKPEDAEAIRAYVVGETRAAAPTTGR